MIEKIMEIEDARIIYNDILFKLGVVDLDKICPIEIDKSANGSVDELDEQAENKIIQGIACGLISWDEEQGCVKQQLTKPILSGNQPLGELHYKRPITLNMQHLATSQDRAGMIARLVGHATNVIGTMEAFDATMAIMLLRRFFGA